MGSSVACHVVSQSRYRAAYDEAERALAALDGYGDEAELLRLIARYCVTRAG